MRCGVLRVGRGDDLGDPEPSGTVGEQRAHATGTVAAAWQGGAYQLAVRPTSPRWTRDRPLDATVRPVAGGHEVVVTRA